MFVLIVLDICNILAALDQLEFEDLGNCEQTYVRRVVATYNYEHEDAGWRREKDYVLNF